MLCFCEKAIFFGSEESVAKEEKYIKELLKFVIPCFFVTTGNLFTALRNFENENILSGLN